MELSVIVKVEWLRMMSVEKALVIMGLFALFVQNHFALTITVNRYPAVKEALGTYGETSIPVLVK